MERGFAKRQHADLNAFPCCAGNPLLHSDIRTLTALGRMTQHLLMNRHQKLMSK